MLFGFLSLFGLDQVECEVGIHVLIHALTKDAKFQVSLPGKEDQVSVNRKGAKLGSLFAQESRSLSGMAGGMAEKRAEGRNSWRSSWRKGWRKGWLATTTISGRHGCS